MKHSSYLVITALCISLFSCDNAGTNDAATTTTPASEPVAQEQAPAQQPEVTTAPETEVQGAEEGDADVEKMEIVAQNLQYEPKELRVKPEQRIQITLDNQGDVQYSIKFELPEGEQELRTPVPPGRKAGLVFTTPKKKGTYNFYSPLPNQRGRGMTGTLIVE